MGGVVRPTGASGDTASAAGGHAAALDETDDAFALVLAAAALSGWDERTTSPLGQAEPWTAGLGRVFPRWATYPSVRDGAVLSTVCRFPDTMHEIPYPLRLAWRGALSPDGASHVLFATGSAESLMARASLALARGQLLPLRGPLRDDLATPRPGVIWCGVRLLCEEAVARGRDTVEARIVVVGAVSMRGDSIALASPSRERVCGTLSSPLRAAVLSAPLA